MIYDKLSAFEVSITGRKSITYRRQGYGGKDHFVICVDHKRRIVRYKELRVQEFRIAAGTPDPGKPPDEFYVIRAGDVLNINAWKEPSL